MLEIFIKRQVFLVMALHLKLPKNGKKNFMKLVGLVSIGQKITAEEMLLLWKELFGVKKCLNIKFQVDILK